MVRKKILVINIIEDKVQVNTVVSAFSKNFFIRVLVKPVMKDKNINIGIETIYIGKVAVKKERNA